MAKKEKVADLKPKAEKITDEQLKELQSAVSSVNKIKFDIGVAEVQKQSMLNAVAKFTENILALQNKFQEEYGTYDINIQDGTINYKDEQTDKKD